MFLHWTQGFWKRTRHAVAGVFVARNDTGHEHFAYSRFGSALGAAFIRGLGSQRAETAQELGSTASALLWPMVSGGNVFREFWPDMKRQFRKH
jgi:2-methylcitrate dehydratase PrpD